MNTHPTPSAYILRKAWQLGQKMARKERRLQPDPTGVAQFPTYQLFRQAHRHRLEQRSAFQYWDVKLQRLIEREGNGRGLAIDDPRVWDALFTHIGGPIRNVFWAAWEDAYQLESLYREAINQAEQARLASAAPLRIYQLQGQAADASDPDVWNGIAQQLARDGDLGDTAEPPPGDGAA